MRRQDRTRRGISLGLAVASAVLGLVLVPPAQAGLGGSAEAPPSVLPPTTSPATCGPDDLPETGIQGDVPRADQLSGRAVDGYNCGLALVGHSNLGGRGGNANMAWSGDCAYIAGNGVAVVDVSDPANPVHVRTLHGPGSDATLETLHAMTTADRAVLVAGRYNLSPNDNPAPMDIYDVSDCANPVLKSTFWFPRSIHNLTLSADARRVYATSYLQSVDISDLENPVFDGDIQQYVPMPGTMRNPSHEAWPSVDGTRLYIGGQVIGIGEIFTILDISRWPAEPPTVVSQSMGRGHSIRLAGIGGRKYVLHSEESIVDPTSKGCVPEQMNPFAGAAQPWLTDITDEANPVRVSQFRLAINEPAYCAVQAASGVNASVHYHDVDDAADTTFALLSMWHAGVRIVDVRDPAHPTEVAYFNPGAVRTASGGVALDRAWAHIRYVPETGHIWFTTATAGFWVVELEPHVRAALGLAPQPTAQPQGAPGTKGLVGAVPVAATAGASAYYCTIDTGTAAATA